MNTARLSPFAKTPAKDRGLRAPARAKDRSAAKPEAQPEHVVQPGHEHEFEAEYGLPEALPPGERVLWQGSPRWQTLAVQAFHVRQIAVYFAVVLAMRAAFVLSEGSTVADAARAVSWLLPLVVFALGMLLFLARLSARTTVYTLTDRRVVMRIGIVLTLTFNLPLARLAGAGLREHGTSGVGDIPLQLARGEKIAYLHLWPHARPWKAARPEPMLRCIPEVHKVAQLLGQAWSTETGAALAAMTGAQAASPPTQPRSVGAQPA